MKSRSILLALVLLGSPGAWADKAPQDRGVPPGLAKKGGVPPGQAKKGLAPGLAKKGGLPPGLAKKLGATTQGTAYIALDPEHDDRAWFLRNGRWVLRQGFEDDVRGEVRQLLAAPPPRRILPPVPLPPLNIHLRVMVFTS